MPNTGTLESTGSGKLALQGNYGNTGGMIGGTNVVLQGATISGGTLSAGTIRPDFSGATLNGVTLALGCQYVLTNGANTTLNGSITNNGQIKLNAFGTTTTQLVITGTVTVNGNGTITGLGGANNQITGSGTLNIGTQQTLQGGGLLVKVNVLKNQGMIIGNSTTAPLILDCPSGTGVCTSPGLIEAESGGTVQMTCTVSAACTFDDTNGTLSANGGTVTLTGGATLHDGMLTSSGGMFDIPDGTLDTVTSSAAIDVGNGETATLKGTIMNNGQINQTATNCSGCSMGTVVIDGTVIVKGSGMWTMSGIGQQNAVTGKHGTDMVTLSSTMQGTGMVDMVNFTVAPTGSIMANTSLPFTISMGPVNVYKQMGMLTVSPISTAVIIGKFANFNSLIASTSTGTLTGGTYNISGTFKFDNANIVTNAANIILSGQIVDQNNVNALLNFANNSLHGSFTLTGGQNLTTPGTFSNAGKLIVAKGSRFSIGGSTTSYNQTSGTTTVDGALAVPVGGMVNLTGGTLAGAGTLSGNVSVGNTSGAVGTFIIGDSIKKAAPISITNNYTQLVTGAMDVQIGGTTTGTRYSQLNITGTAALAGTLNIAVINNFKPTIGQTFTLLNASTGITGTFSTVNGTAINANEHFSVSYTSDTVVLTVVSGP